MGNEPEQTQPEIAKLQLEQERHKLAQMQRRQGAVEGLGRGAAAVGGAAAKGGRRVLIWFGKALLVLGAMFALFVSGEFKDAADPAWDFSYRVGFAAGRLSDVAYGWMLLIAAVAAFMPWRSRPGQEIRPPDVPDVGARRICIGTDIYLGALAHVLTHPVE